MRVVSNHFAMYDVCVCPLTAFLHYFKSLALCWSTSPQFVLCFSQILFSDFRTLYLIILSLTRLKDSKNKTRKTFWPSVSVKIDSACRSQTAVLLETWLKWLKISCKKCFFCQLSLFVLGVKAPSTHIYINPTVIPQWTVNLFLTVINDVIRVQAPPFPGSLPDNDDITGITFSQINPKDARVWQMSVGVSSSSLFQSKCWNSTGNKQDREFVCRLGTSGRLVNFIPCLSHLQEYVCSNRNRGDNRQSLL